MARNTTLADLGYDDFFESNRQKLKLGGFSVARVIVEHKGFYKVKNQNGEYLAKITGKRMFEAFSREDYPAVGDFVTITDLDGEHATIHNILPRKTLIKRKHGDKSRGIKKSEMQIVATNIDVAFIVESVGRDFSLNRFERYIALAESGGVKPVIVLNKTDLISQEEVELKISEIKNRFNDVRVISTSSINKEGLDYLRRNIEGGKTYCFLGSSGVGKSSLINQLLGQDMIKTEEIGTRNERGRHATTTRQMYFLEGGGIVVDNPGMREVGVSDDNLGMDTVFDQIVTLSENCKFRNCTHEHEPGCAVLTELNAGGLDAEKYANYINLKKEVEYYDMSEIEKKEKDRKFGKFIKKYKKNSKN